MSDERERLESAIRQAFRAGWWHHENTIQTRDDAEDDYVRKEVKLDRILAALRAPEGRPVGYVVVAHRLTERRTLTNVVPLAEALAVKARMDLKRKADSWVYTVHPIGAPIPEKGHCEGGGTDGE